MQKKFLIYGEFWPGTLPSLLENELRLRGAEVEIFDFTRIVPGIRDRKLVHRFQRRLCSGWYDRRVNQEFLTSARRAGADFIIVSKGLNLNERTILALRSTGATLVNWNPDDFFNPVNSNDRLVAAFPHYDLIVSSRPHLFEEYRQRGARRLAAIDWYYVPELHRPGDGAISHRISFVGSWSPLREEFIAQITVPVEIWGGGWSRSSRSFRAKHEVNARIVSQAEMSQIFSHSRYNLNLITHENRDLSNLRFFEVCASGGLLLTERNRSALSYLEDGRECLMYNTALDVNRILQEQWDLSSIAERGYRKITLGKNSFRDRVSQLVDALR